MPNDDYVIVTIKYAEVLPILWNTFQITPKNKCKLYVWQDAEEPGVFEPQPDYLVTRQPR